MRFTSREDCKLALDFFYMMWKKSKASLNFSFVLDLVLDPSV